MSVFGLKNNQKGFTTISIALTVAIVALLATTLTTLTINQMASIRRSAIENQAYNMAKAGLSAALDDLNTNDIETSGNLPLNPGQDFIDLDDRPNVVRGYRTSYDRQTNTLTSTGVVDFGGLRAEKSITCKTEPNMNTFTYKEYFNDSTYKDSGKTSARWNNDGRLKLPYDFTWTEIRPNGNELIPACLEMIDRYNGRALRRELVSGTTYCLAVYTTSDGWQTATRTTISEGTGGSLAPRDIHYDGLNWWYVVGDRTIMKNGTKVLTNLGRDLYKIVTHPTNRNWVYAIGQTLQSNPNFQYDQATYLAYSTNEGTNWYSADSSFIIHSQWASDLLNGSYYQFGYSFVDIAVSSNNLLYLRDYYGQNYSAFVSSSGVPSNCSRDYKLLRSRNSLTALGNYIYSVRSNQLSDNGGLTVIGPGIFRNTSIYKPFSGMSKMQLADPDNGLLFGSSAFTVYLNGWDFASSAYSSSIPKITDVGSSSERKKFRLGDIKCGYGTGNIGSDPIKFWRYLADAYRQSAAGVSTNVSLEEQNVTEITLNATYNCVSPQSIDFYVNVTDSDAYWESVNLNETHQVARTGNKVRWKAVLNTGSNRDITPYIDDITVTYLAGKKYTIDKSTIRSD